MFPLKLFFVFFFFPAFLLAQEHYSFQHLTVEDGLLSNLKVHAYQDAEGFYWFSSVSGLQRFDGKNFVTYQYDYRRKNISGDWTAKPVEDKERNLWIVNEEGINIYKKPERVLKRLYMSDAFDSSVSNISSIIKDEHGEMWIITRKNIFHYNYLTHKPVLSANIITDNFSVITYSSYAKKINGIWLALSTKEIAFFDFAKRKISYPFKKEINQLPGQVTGLSFFESDNSSNLWMADFVGNFCRYNTSTSQLFSYSILKQGDKQKIKSPNSTIYDLLDDDYGNVWFASDYYGGLLQYDKKKDRFFKIPDENGAEYGFHYNQTVYSLFKDREENIWIDTDLGMNIFNPQLQQFKYIHRKKNDSFSKFGQDITSIFESSTKHIWVGTWGNGVFRYDSNFVFKKNYVHNKNDVTSFGEPLNRAWTFAEDKKGKIWIGCQFGMLSVLNNKTGKFTNKIIPAFEKRTIMNIVKDSNGNFWFGLNKGLHARWNAAADSPVVYKNVKDSSAIDGLCIDDKQNVWLSASDGLYRFDETKKPMIETVVSSQHIVSICLLSDSILACSTSGAGFFLFNKFTNTSRFFNTSNGLSSNIVYGVIPHTLNDLWIIASDGIERLNLLNNTISSFDINDGIQDHLLERAFCKLKSGVVLIAAKSGIIYFNPDNIKSKPPPPDVVITDFSEGRHSLPVDSLLQNKSISLSHDQNVLTLEYASVSFSGRATSRYFYQMEGVDKTWIAAGKRRTVTYANLTPRKYIFKVKAQNQDGMESVNITTLNIAIHLPWWQTWWAYLLWFMIEE